MNNMKKKPTSLPRLDIPAARVPKKKTTGDPFARISLHPLEELEARDLENKNAEISAEFSAQIPVDVHTETFETATNIVSGRPHEGSLDVHNLPTLTATDNVSGRPQDYTEPSTIVKGGRPPVEREPSTPVENSRPLLFEQPSTLEKVGVSPSTEPKNPEKLEQMDVSPSTEKKVDVHKIKARPSTKGDRHRGDLARFDNRIDPTIKKKIDVFCAQFGIPQREFVQQSAVHFIEMWTAKLKKIVDGKPALDDRLSMMLWKTDALIINLYQIYNPENKWKMKDDEFAKKYNGVDPRRLELAIIETQFNAQFKKINSFTYYTSQIEQFMTHPNGDEMLDFLIGHYREKWKAQTGKMLDYQLIKPEPPKKDD